MSHYTELLHTLSSGLQDVTVKVNILGDRVNQLDGKSDSTTPDYADKGALNKVANKVSSLEQSVQDLCKTVSSISSYVKDEISKERGIIEAAMQLKLEHYVTKCVKERIDLAVQSQRVSQDDKLNRIQKDILSEVDSKIKSAIQNLLDSSALVPSKQETVVTELVSPPTIQDVESVSRLVDDIDINALTTMPTPNGDDPLDIQVRKKVFKKK